MDKNTFNERMTAIGACEDDVQRRELLSSLMDEAGADFDRMTELEAENENYKNDNEALRSANMKLFLRVGDKTPDQSDDNKPEQKPEPRKFEDLFNEKGELK